MDVPLPPLPDSASAGTRQVIVWDRGIRAFHWTLVVLVTLCAVTGFVAPPNWLDLHLWGGTGIAGLLVFRLAWGWTGSTFSRFRTFVFSPRETARHLGHLGRDRRRDNLGHNPLGAVMVFALLGVLTVIVATGVLALGGALKQGPLAFALSFAEGMAARQIHTLFAFALIGLIAAHLGGVAFESWRTHENLTRSMFTGRKRPLDARAGAFAVVPARPLAAAACVAVVAVIAIPVLIGLASLPGRGVPVAALDPVYSNECGSCHMAYPPSLAPAALWTATTNGLEAHFGENAGLDESTTRHIREWLVANSAGQFDTRPANLFRKTSPALPERITATPAWIRIHREIPDAVFKSPKIGTKGACNACHGDAATGRFDPQRIAIPGI